MTHRLRLLEDRLTAGAAAALAPLPRVLVVLEGRVAVTALGTTASLGPEAVWHGASVCSIAGGSDGARVLRWELGADASDPAPAAGSRLLLAHPIELDPATAYLMRCDRVDFDPGGIALPHRHQGGGIRWLIQGTLDVRVGEAPPRRVAAGGAWFESGREPVLATAAPEAPTSFLRVAILPAAIRGRTSIVYVDPADAARGRPRRYTVFIDEPIPT